MSRLFFAPFSLAAGVVAGLVGRRLFEHAWALVDEQEPPESGHRRATWGKVIVAAALQGAVFAGVRAATDRGARQAFASVTGSWPGEREPDPEP